MVEKLKEEIRRVEEESASNKMAWQKTQAMAFHHLLQARERRQKRERLCLCFYRWKEHIESVKTDNMIDAMSNHMFEFKTKVKVWQRLTRRRTRMRELRKQREFDQTFGHDSIFI